MLDIVFDLISAKFIFLIKYRGVGLFLPAAQTFFNNNSKHNKAIVTKISGN